VKIIIHFLYESVPLQVTEVVHESGTIRKVSDFGVFIAFSLCGFSKKLSKVTSVGKQKVVF